MTTLEDVLELLAADPGTAGVFTDFDGTLAPVVADPERARPLPEALEALAALASRLRRVAVVSGRPLCFLAEAFSAIDEPLELYGLHGIEHMTADGPAPVEAALRFVPTVAEAAAEAEAAGIDGLVVEDKTYSFTLHWRRAEAPEQVANEALPLADRLGAAYGFEIRPGKASVELVPPIGINKGTVVTERSQGLASLAFLGDDLGDLDAFSALDVLALEGKNVARVAVSGPEAPAELLERADVVLAGPVEAARLLGRLADLVRAGP